MIIFTQIQQKYQEQDRMIYGGHAADPRHRFYNITPASQINYQSNHSNSPVVRDRYVKFKQQPVNLSNSNHRQLDLSQSNIYTKQGILKRNQIGWDGVKLTEYVTEQISQNYLDNRQMLQRFKKQAEANKKNAKRRHINEAMSYQKNENYHTILPVLHQKYTQLAPTPLKLMKELESQSQIEEEQVVHVKNIAVNTNNTYQKQQREKYKKMKHKYQTLKEKYRFEKYTQNLQRQRFEQMEQRRESQRISLQKIRDIEQDLMKISLRLQASNALLNQKLHQTQIKQAQFQKQCKKTSRISQNKKKFKTEPIIPIEQNEYEEVPEILPSQICKIPLNRTQKYSLNNLKPPKVVYSLPKQSRYCSYQGSKNFVTKNLFH